MTRAGALVLGLVVAAAGACTSGRFAVEITVSSRALSADRIARIAQLDFDVSGGDALHQSYSDLPRAFAGGEERVVFLPTRSAGGAITVAVTARDASMTAVAAGTGTVTLRPGAAAQLRVELSAVADSDGLPATAVDLGGSGDASAAVQLAFDRASYHFGTIVTGDHSADVTFTLTNSGSAESGALAGALDGPRDGAAAFVRVSDACAGASLAPGASCAVVLSYRPASAGSDAATLTFTGALGGSATLMLAGDALAGGDLQVTPAVAQLPPAVVGELGAEARFDVTNGGSAMTGPLSVILSGTDATSFELSSDGCSGVALAGAATCSFHVRFHPDAAGLKTASVTVNSSPGGAASASLNGTALTPAHLSASLASQGFGAVAPGTQSAVTTVQLTNDGMAGSGALLVALTGTDAGQFTVTDNGCSAPLAAGASCSVGVAFAPLASGAKSAALEVSSQPGGKATVALSGSGVMPAQLTLTPSAPPAFADTVAGALGDTQTFTLANVGEATSGALASVLSDTTHFTLVSDGCMGLHLGGGTSCTVKVQFSPASAGNKSATLTVSGSPGGAPQVSLAGKGLVPAQLGIGPGSNDFLSVVVNTDSADVTFTVTNNGEVASGAITVALSGSNAAEFIDASSPLGNKCAGATLAPLGTCAIKVHFHPTSVATGKSATLAVSATPGGGASALLSGSGVSPGALSISPTGHDYGDVIVAQSSGDWPFTVTNTGGAPLGPLGSSVTGPFAITAAQDGCAGATLAPLGSCALKAHFAPSGTGGQSGTLTVAVSGGASTAASLAGNGLAAPSLSIAPSSKAFGSVNLGSASTTTNFTVTNSGAGAGTITLVQTGSTADFAVTNNCTTLGGGGATCIISASLQPATQGSKSLTLTVSGANGGSTAATLTGYGFDPVTLDVVLAGNGAGYGSVISTSPSSPALNCPGTCTQIFDRGTVVTLSASASPSAAAALSSWSLSSGTCNGTGTCNVTLSASRTATANFTLKTYTLTVTNSHAGSAAGSVTGGGINCGATCSVVANYGTSIPLSATPSSGGFAGWSGDCSGASCSVSLTAARNVTATFSPFNYMFVRAATNNGVLGGLSGADGLCQTAANNAGRAGTYRAWLSSSTVDARDRLNMPGTNTPARGWIRVDGLPFADQISDMATGSTSHVYYPPNVSETNAPINAGAVTGSGSLGLKASGTCGDWALSSGTADGGDSYDADRWYSASGLGCGSNLWHLYCFGVDYATQLPPPVAPAPAKRIFTTSGTWKPTATALTSADALCNSEGRAAYGSAKNFVALLATTTATAASRLTGSTGPWVRNDGVVVFATYSDLAAQTMKGGANLTTAGIFSSQPMWSGAADVGSMGTTQTTCNNWMTADATIATLGSPSVVGTYFFRAWAGIYACSTSNRLVCLEL